MQTVPHDHVQGRIAYTSDIGGTFDIWLYRPLEGQIFQLSKGLGAEFSVPYWSSDNRRIAFIGNGNVVNLLDTVTLAVARIDQIEPYTLLNWSPDSRYLAYVKNAQITVYDTFTHFSYAIHEPGASDVQWFPSGKELLFAAPDFSGNTQLFRVRADGTERRQITQNTDGPLHDIRISPDGTFALYTYPGVSISIISTMNLATGTIYTLEGGPQAKNYFPVWSPDSGASPTAQPPIKSRTIIHLFKLIAAPVRIKKHWHLPIVSLLPSAGLQMVRKLLFYRVVKVQEVQIS